jgi:hypothetical protein
MKKLLFSVALMLMIGVGSSFANKIETVNQKVISSFQKDFAGAKDVKWENSKEFAKATFNLNGQVLFAYYSENGEMIAMTRNIVSTQLPINLLNELKKDYSNFWISDLFEMATGNETAYYVTIENADFVIVLKSTDATSWEQFKKDKKEAE